MEPDFLSDNTRKLRKLLLLTSLIGFSISKLELTVQKVSVAGSEISISKMDALPFILSLVILYFLVSFTFFALYEYSRYYRRQREDYLEKLSKGTVYSEKEVFLALKQAKKELQTLEDESTHLKTHRAIEKIDKKKEDILKLRKIADFYKYYRVSFFERLRLRGMRTFIDLFTPIIIGIYTLIVVLFFTNIPNISDKGQVLINTPSKNETLKTVDTTKYDLNSTENDN